MMRKNRKASCRGQRVRSNFPEVFDGRFHGEFNGKDLDNAIEEACTYFDAPREKLEIEIIQDPKSGIFGIVRARKAKIRARRAPLRETVQSLLGKKHEEYRIAHKSKACSRKGRKKNL